MIPHLWDTNKLCSQDVTNDVYVIFKFPRGIMVLKKPKPSRCNGICHFTNSPCICLSLHHLAWFLCVNDSPSHICRVNITKQSAHQSQMLNISIYGKTHFSHDLMGQTHPNKAWTYFGCLSEQPILCEQHANANIWQVPEFRGSCHMKEWWITQQQKTQEQWDKRNLIQVGEGKRKNFICICLVRT